MSLTLLPVCISDCTSWRNSTKDFWIIQYWEICILPISFPWASPTCLNTSHVWIQAMSEYKPWTCMSTVNSVFLCALKIFSSTLCWLSLCGLVTNGITSNVLLARKEKKNIICIFAFSRYSSEAIQKWLSIT